MKSYTRRRRIRCEKGLLSLSLPLISIRPLSSILRSEQCWSNTSEDGPEDIALTAIEHGDRDIIMFLLD